jgi:tetratricopeptide (TPR) repeat protein
VTDRRLLVGVLLILGVAVGVRDRGLVWRAAYPYLPRQVQAVPYRLRELTARDEMTPVPLPTVAATPVAIGTARPAATSPASPTPSSVPTATPGRQLPPVVALPPGRHEYQTWNNCGPATVSMALGRLGQSPGQAEAARVLKPDPDDKNVSPTELAAYARQRGVGAMVRVNGTVDTLRQLLSMGLPVIVETWFIPKPNDEMGHYRLLVGYDQPAKHFVADDSYHGPGITLDYDEFDRLWRVFDRVFVVLYPPTRDGEVRRSLGALADDDSMYVSSVAEAEREIMDAPDTFGFFNLGTSLLGLGDAAGAAGAFDRARDLGLPWRMLWYQFGPFEAYAAVGRWSDVQDLSEANLRNASNLEESQYWLGRARQAQGDTAGALEAWRKAVQLNPGYGAAVEALASAGSP